MLAAALHLMEPEIDAIVESKLATMGPINATMARGEESNFTPIPTAPPMEDYRKWLAKQVPNAPPLELFETWQRNRSAIVVQKMYRGRGAHIGFIVRSCVEKLPADAKTAAIAGGLDGMGELFREHLGKNVWARAIFNSPNEWTEEQMVEAIADVLKNPRGAKHLYLLTKPTKHERVLLGLSSYVATKQESAREVRAALKIQKTFRGRQKRLGMLVRFQLEGLPKEQVAQAAARGLDAISDLISDALGKNVWARAVHNAPDDWEEEQMLFAMRDTLARPHRSAYIWLLGKPTKYEQMLLSAFTTGSKAFTGQL